MEPWQNLTVFGLTQLFVLVGLFGLVVPLFPGIIVIWLATLGYGIMNGFGTAGVIFFVILTLLMITGEVIDNVMMGVGARKGGAAWVNIIAALVAGVVGTLLFPPIGGVIAAPLVVLLLEYRRAGNMEKAIQALRGLATGWGLSFLVRFGIGVLMMFVWWLWVWLG